jgi:hypothetical protein
MSKDQEAIGGTHKIMRTIFEKYLSWLLTKEHKTYMALIAKLSDSQRGFH